MDVNDMFAEPVLEKHFQQIDHGSFELIRSEIIYFAEAYLKNFTDLDEYKMDYLVGSGEGFDVDSAVNAAVGEGFEVYCSDLENYCGGQLQNWLSTFTQLLILTC